MFGIYAFMIQIAADEFSFDRLNVSALAVVYLTCLHSQQFGDVCLCVKSITELSH